MLYACVFAKVQRFLIQALRVFEIQSLTITSCISWHGTSYHQQHNWSTFHDIQSRIVINPKCLKGIQLLKSVRYPKFLRIRAPPLLSCILIIFVKNSVICDRIQAKEAHEELSGRRYPEKQLWHNEVVNSFMNVFIHQLLLMIQIKVVLVPNFNYNDQLFTASDQRKVHTSRKITLRVLENRETQSVIQSHAECALEAFREVLAP